MMLFLRLLAGSVDADDNDHDNCPIVEVLTDGSKVNSRLVHSASSCYGCFL